MTTVPVVANPAKSRIHTAGAVCMAAGLLGSGASIYLASTSPVSAEGFTFPHGARELTGLQVLIALSRVGLIFGLLGLWWSGTLPGTRIARFGRYVALGMMAVLTVTEGLAVTVPRTPLDGTPPAFGVVYGVYTILLGVALLAAGFGVARSGVWRGWKRWLPLSLGVWLLFVVVPALALSFDAARWAMSSWMLLFALLGWVMTREDGSAPGQPTAGHQSPMRSARWAALVTWVYVATFGAPVIPNAAYIAQNGRLPRFLDAFAMYGGPWTVPFDEGTVLLLLLGFLVVTLAAAWAAWLVWNGSKSWRRTQLGSAAGRGRLLVRLRTPAPVAAGLHQGCSPDRGVEDPQLVRALTPRATGLELTLMHPSCPWSRVRLTSRVAAPCSRPWDSRRRSSAVRRRW